MLYLDGQSVEVLRTDKGKNGPELRCACPWCGSPDNGSINEDTLMYKCWGCDERSKATTDIQIDKQVIDIETWGDHYSQQERRKDKAPSVDVRDKYLRLQVRRLSINEYVKSYFAKHGIPIEYAKKYRIGFCHDTPDYPDKEVAQILGLLNDKENNRFWERIIFPITRGKRVIYLQGRAVGQGSRAKFINMHGEAPLFNADVITKADTVYLTEGIPDCLSLLSHGYDNAVAVLGAGSLVSKVAKQFEDRSVVIIFDSDKAGSSGAESAAETLEASGARCSIVTLPDGQDLSDYLKGGGKDLKGKDRRNEVVRGTRRKNKSGSNDRSRRTDSSSYDDGVGNNREGDDREGSGDDSRESIDTTEREKIVTYLRSEQNLLVFGYGDVGSSGKFDCIINISNVEERKSTLKVHLQIELPSTKSYGGIVDLGSIRARANFAKELAEHFKTIQEIDFKIILNDVATGVRAQIETRKQEKIRTKEHVMSEHEKQEAIEFLRSDRLLFKIKNALTEQNVIGEDVNKLLLYLIFTSRIMKKPVSCVIKGLSSSGKTHLMKQTMTLIPPEGKHVMQDATAKAFHYLEEDALMHKMIVIGEMHGSEDSSYTIREAQDGIGSGDLIILTVEKDPDSNQMVTREKRVKGPCGFITSTTNPELHPENETRNFSLFVQVNDEKVRTTGQVLVNKYTRKSTLLSDDELKVYHNAQRCLQYGVSVLIPYVGFVLDRFPTSPIRVMRDRERFFTIIETIALIHQFQRDMHVDEETGERWIDSTVEDYHTALILLDEILMETLYELPPKSMEIYERIVEMRKFYEQQNPPENTTNFDDPYQDDITHAGPFYATYKNVADEMGMKAKDIKRWAKPLFEGGYLTHFDDNQGRGGRGRETKMVPTEKEFYQQFLPKPRDVMEFLGQEEARIYNPLTGEKKTLRLNTEEGEEFMDEEVNI